MADFIHSLQEFVWGSGMLVFFLGAGIYFTIQSGFFQITKIQIWIKNTIGVLKKGKTTKNFKENISVTQFQSFCTALAATLGTGNITGVATALMCGGPGAIFWMWVSAFFGMMTTYAENFLGIKYRYKDEKGQWKGGAMVYMERGLGCKPLAIVFAVCCLGASFGMGNMVQGNSMAVGLEKAFHIPTFISGSFCMIAVAVVLTGGMKRIAILTEKLVPFMAAIYLVGAIIVLFFYRDRIVGAFGLIFQDAFHTSAAVGGISGYGVKQAVRMGIARGIFSNEAGLGSSVMAHAQSDVEDARIQGMWGILEVFIDTILVCTVTALVILVSGVPYYQVDRVDGTTLTGMAFASVLPWGKEFLAGATALFAFATMIGWSYFGTQTADYLAGEKGVKVYRLFYILITLPGCMIAPIMIWELSDTLNGMMAIPNLLSLFFLRKEVEYMMKEKNRNNCIKNENYHTKTW